MKYVENLSPYKEHTLGYIHHHNKWIQMPRDMVNLERENLLSDIQTASKFVMDDQCHGMRAGVGLKKLNTPGNTQGVLICWPKNTNRLTFLENPNSKTMIVKKLSSMHRDDVCMLYLYHYGDTQLEEEPRSQQPPHQPQPPASMMWTTKVPDELTRGLAQTPGQSLLERRRSRSTPTLTMVIGCKRPFCQCTRDAGKHSYLRKNHEEMKPHLALPPRIHHNRRRLITPPSTP